MTIATMDWIAGLLIRWSNGSIELPMVDGLMADSGLLRDHIDQSNRTVGVREHIGGDIWTIDY